VVALGVGHRRPICPRDGAAGFSIGALHDVLRRAHDARAVSRHAAILLAHPTRAPNAKHSRTGTTLAGQVARSQARLRAVPGHTVGNSPGRASASALLLGRAEEMQDLVATAWLQDTARRLVERDDAMLAGQKACSS